MTVPMDPGEPREPTDGAGSGSVRHADPGSVVNAFLRRLLEDRARGAERPLAAYLAEFPGHEDTVAREHAHACGSSQGSGRDPGAGAEAAFRAAFEEDRRAGRERPLEEYLERFPGAELAVAAAYAALLAQQGPDPGGAPAASLEPGAWVGRYRLVRELGRGGQGVVHLAEDPRLGRHVALKLLTGLSAGSPERLRRFQREASIAARLDHPGICAVYEWDTAGGMPFVAMRHLDGRTLAEHVQAWRAAPGGAAAAPVSEAIGWIEQAARALHAAHEQGVVHRDVKPSNLMVTAGGEVVLLDFGLARVLEADEPSLTRSGDTLGTLAYMSPEQVAGGKRPLDRRTDVYSLGVCLYEAVVLRRPFTAPTRAGLLREILRGAPPDPREQGRAVSADLRVVILTAMAWDPDDRYASALALAEDLRALRESRPIAARPAGWWTRARRWARREPALAALAVGLVLALGLLAGSAGYLIAQRPVLRAGEEEIQRSELDRLFAEQLRGGGGGTLDGYLRDHPENTLGRVVAAISKLALQDPAGALALLEGHPPEAPEPWAVERVRAAVLGRLGRVEEQRALEARLPDPTGPIDCFAAGYLLMALQDKELAAPRAQGFLERAVALSDRPQMIYHTMLAECAYHAGDIDLAESVTDAIARSWPDHAISQLVIGQVRMARVDLAGARAAFERALVLDPDATVAHWGLTLLLDEAGEPEAARGHYERAAALAADFPTALFSLHENRGRQLAKGGRHDEALPCFERALELQPDHAPTRLELARSLLELGETEWAAEELRRVLAVDPENAEARAALTGIVNR